MRFRTTVELGGKTATGMRIPPEVVEALGAGKKPPVRVTIGGPHVPQTAKKPETRVRRIDKALAMLREGRRQPYAESLTAAPSCSCRAQWAQQ